MVSIETLRELAGLSAGDTSKDTVLRQLAAGSLAFIAHETGRLLVCPPMAYQQVLSPPEPPRVGLSPGEAWIQRVLMRTAPQRKLTGTVTVAAGATELVGTGTKFTTQLAVGSTVIIAGQSIAVATISSDTALSLAEEHVAGATDVLAFIEVIALHQREDLQSAWTALDTAEFEFENSSIYPLGDLFPSGKRTVRVRYLVGFEEGYGPPEVELLFNKIFRAAYSSRAKRSKTVTVDGAFTVTWADLSEEKESLKEDLATVSEHLAYNTAEGVFLQGASSQWP
jgi:hypothetical protein